MKFIITVDVEQHHARAGRADGYRITMESHEKNDDMQSGVYIDTSSVHVVEPAAIERAIDLWIEQQIHRLVYGR